MCCDARHSTWRAERAIRPRRPSLAEECGSRFRVRGRMRDYDPCSSCGRHVKAQESPCPFCGASQVRSSHRRRRLPSRRSRAQWLAFGSTLAIAGCGDRTGATADSVRVATPQGATPDAATPEGSVPARAGDTFPCITNADTTACHRANEYCRSGSPSCGPVGCGPVPFACIATPSCDCLYDAGVDYTECAGDDAGAIQVSCPCYGAPPRRLERVARTKRTAGGKSGRR
jgi:hypothetical protein